MACRLEFSKNEALCLQHGNGMCSGLTPHLVAVLGEPAREELTEVAEPDDADAETLLLLQPRRGSALKVKGLGGVDGADLEACASGDVVRSSDGPARCAAAEKQCGWMRQDARMTWTYTAAASNLQLPAATAQATSRGQCGP